jgi:hypothetical protein
MSDEADTDLEYSPAFLGFPDPAQEEEDLNALMAMAMQWSYDVQMNQGIPIRRAATLPRSSKTARCLALYH